MGRAGPRCQAGAPPAEGWRCRHARARVDWSGRGRLPPAVHRARSDMADERRTAAHEMFEADLASRALGIELLSAGGGRAVVRMRVTVSMVNGHAIAHGGYVFLLADTAFACACNSHGPVTVAAAADIVFVRPVREGDLLLARAEERTRYGRGGVYDVTVMRGDEVVAEFRGHSRTIGRQDAEVGRPARQTQYVSWRMKNSAFSSSLSWPSPERPSKYASRGAPGAKRISIDAGSPDSLRNACNPPSGTNRKSPAVASIQRAPSNRRTAPERTKNDSEIVRWKCGSGPLGGPAMSHRYRPNCPLADVPVAR